MEGSMASPSEVVSSDFWEYLHAALGLQHSASCLATQGQLEDAMLFERQAISLLLDATCSLEPDEPALVTVRQLAAAGLSRLHTLKRKTERKARAPRSSSTIARPRRSRKVVAAKRSA
jgi:hypothetical protein